MSVKPESIIEEIKEEKELIDSLLRKSQTEYLMVTLKIYSMLLDEYNLKNEENLKIINDVVARLKIFIQSNQNMINSILQKNIVVLSNTSTQNYEDITSEINDLIDMIKYLIKNIETKIDIGAINNEVIKGGSIAENKKAKQIISKTIIEQIGNLKWGLLQHITQTLDKVIDKNKMLLDFYTKKEEAEKKSPEIIVLKTTNNQIYTVEKDNDVSHLRYWSPMDGTDTVKEIIGEEADKMYAELTDQQKDNQGQNKSR